MPPPMVHEHHEGLFHHHHHEEEEEGEGGEGSPHRHHSAASETTEAKRKKSPVEEDLVETGGGCRREMWLFLNGEMPPPGVRSLRRFARKYEFFSVLLVCYLVMVDIITSIPSVAEWSSKVKLLDHIEECIYVMFTIEYVMRLWSCMESKSWSAMGSIRGRLACASQVLMIVDFIVLTAYYIGFLLPGGADTGGFAVLRMVRLFRVAALLKMERKANSFGKIFNVLKKKKNELVATLFTAVVLMVMSATTMYYIENGSNDDFASVPAAMWWSVTALTTVGYGDVTPVTDLGKILGSVVAFFGVGLFALPAGILGSGFVEEVEGEGDEEAEEVGEIMDELEAEKKKIIDLQISVQGIRKTVDGVSAAQKEITELMRQLVGETVSAPATQKPLALQDPKSGLSGGGVPTHTWPSESNLGALQDQVARKLDTIRRAKSGDVSREMVIATFPSKRKK